MMEEPDPQVLQVLADFFHKRERERFILDP